MRSTRMRLHIGASRLHRWLALIIGVQLLLWFTSGLVMSLLPIERVRGEHLVEREDGGVLPAQDYAPLDRIAAGTPLRSARHRLLLGRPVVEIETASGELRLHDAATGDRLPAIDATTASRIASAAYRGRPAPAVAVARVTTGSTEYKGRLPAWQAAFADGEATRIYIDDAGRIAAVRTGTWRFYDFFWALHIMDWSEHEDFNTPWLKAFAIGGLLLAIAGTILLYLRWPRKRRRRAEG
ncbi:PepSY domain-containing protein [Sphingomonas sp. IC-56]|uniref:PepSY domain-containing protein n=1 Tax=Sphingomonas TaxID=13687 RepID=UPI000EAD3F9A|nr:PepSY domain-containing protein [Sphingomonas sp. IC-56]MCD2322549.1 PepSY domain-containing protein [Sphingomonas sp. IC-56]